MAARQTGDGVIGVRALLGPQPARTLLVDLTPPFCTDVGNDLCDVLENLFSIACNISGPSRIPFFSLLALTSYPELLLPFSYVRNNHARISTAIGELRSMIDQLCSADKASSCIDQGLSILCSQYRRQVQTTQQSGSGLCHQMEVVIATCQNVALVQKQVESMVTTLDLEHFKRIQVLSLSELSYLPIDDILLSSQTSSNTSNPADVSFSGVVEVVSLEQDLLCLQNYFNTWLLDTSTDSEHMQIVLPASSPGESRIVVKCDLHQRVMNPAQLPFISQFTVHSDSSTMKMVFPSTSKAMGMTVPIYKLHVTSLLPPTALCDSIVYGMPTVAQPTQCWKVDWDELERNQQLFRTVCQTLLEKDLAMLAELTPTQGKKLAGTKDQYEQLPTGHFVMIPAANGSLLIKSVAAKELMLPSQSRNQGDEPTEECKTAVSSSLGQLETLDNYNPLFQTSGLYGSLKSQLKKTAPQRPQKRTLDLVGVDGQGDFVHVGKSAAPSNRGKKAYLHEPSACGDFEEPPVPSSTGPGNKPANRPAAPVRYQPVFQSSKKSRTKPVLSFPTSL